MSGVFGRQGDPIFSNPVLSDKSCIRQVVEESKKILSRT